MRGIRGATTVKENTVVAMTDAVNELLDDIEAHNQQETEPQKA